jgi:two-component system chemotaxis sensor kinase CheA
VVQYRNEILPLIHVSRALRQRRRPGNNGRPGSRRRTPNPPAADPGDTIQVVVYSGKGQRVGLVVDRILDIAEETLVSRSRANRPGVLFSAVVQGRVTEFLDVEGIIRTADPDLFEQPQPIAGEA